MKLLLLAIAIGAASAGFNCNDKVKYKDHSGKEVTERLTCHPVTRDGGVCACFHGAGSGAGNPPPLRVWNDGAKPPARAHAGEAWEFLSKQGAGYARWKTLTWVLHDINYARCAGKLTPASTCDAAFCKSNTCENFTPAAAPVAGHSTTPAQRAKFYEFKPLVSRHDATKAADLRVLNGEKSGVHPAVLEEYRDINYAHAGSLLLLPGKVRPDPEEPAFPGFPSVWVLASNRLWYPGFPSFKAASTSLRGTMEVSTIGWGVHR